MKRILVDERTEHINGLVSFFCLLLTQFALVAVIVYKRYFMGLPQESVTGISWIAGLSMGGYWAVRLYLSGILPVISFKKMLLIYILLVTSISAPTYLIHGWPEADRWYEVLFPFLGVAVVLVIYSLIAYFGKRRIDQIGLQEVRE